MNNKSIPPIYENFTQLNNGEIPQFDYIKIYHSFLKLKANELILFSLYKLSSFTAIYRPVDRGQAQWRVMQKLTLTKILKKLI